ncbi:MAG: KamA family radical SAM protein [bacterium]
MVNYPHVSIPEPWASVPKKKWMDWRWQLANRLQNSQELQSFFALKAEETENLIRCSARFRTAITPFYAALVSAGGRQGALWKQVIPDSAELTETHHLLEDPLDEKKNTPLPGLVRRYSNRALLLTTERCAVYCRFCTRKYFVGNHEQDLSRRDFDGVIQFLSNHSEIKEIILSGGDPLTLTDASLGDVLCALRSLPQVEIIRISSRIPVVLPYRITENLCALIRQYHPIFLQIHINHPQEITAELREACQRLSDAGISLGSQTVLLKGVNDDASVLEELFTSLLTLRIRPYSLYHCDYARGTEHFQTSIQDGITIMEHLQRQLSGLAVPHYIVDAPFGIGKIPILPNSIRHISENEVRLCNSMGVEVSYFSSGEVRVENPLGVSGSSQSRKPIH